VVPDGNQAPPFAILVHTVLDKKAKDGTSKKTHESKKEKIANTLKRLNESEFLPVFSGWW